MRVGVPNQAPAGETRVALTPDVVRRLGQRQLDVVVASGAGERSHVPDAAFQEAGATIGEAWSAEIVAVVRAPSAEDIGRLSRGAVVIGFLNPLADAETARALAGAGVTSFAVEAIPRITRAPASSNAASGRCAASPAPRSTTRSSLRAPSRRTTSGVSATRVSPAGDWLGTPTFIFPRVPSCGRERLLNGAIGSTIARS